MLRCRNVKITQGTFQLTADLNVPVGAMVAVMGPSGAGKSTLLNAIAGFITPETGRIIWDGQDLTDLPPGQRPLSMLFQDNNLFPHLTIAQNVGLGLRADLRLSAGQHADVTAALARVGLAGMEARKPAALSGGQQSRAALARVLLAGRPLVLLDEPFAALGPGLKRDMLDLMRDTLVAAGRTVLMITHNPVDARHISDQIVVVADGKAMPPQQTAQVFDNPPPALRDYLGDVS